MDTTPATSITFLLNTQRPLPISEKTPEILCIAKGQTRDIALEKQVVKTPKVYTCQMQRL